MLIFLEDDLSSFQKGDLTFSKAIHLIDFNKEEISKATGVPVRAVRYDEQMPQILRDQLREWANLLNLVVEFFEGDREKTALWFKITNPFLGNITPRDMLRLGLYKKLFRFVKNAIAENKAY